MNENARAGFGERLGTFLVGSWLNRRHTRLVSSIILGILPGAALLAVLFAHPDSVVTSTDLVSMAVFVILSAVSYPAARELYHRLTHPIRQSIGGIRLGGPLLPIAWAIRLWVYLVLWMLSIPLGIIGAVYLGVSELTGRGRRILERGETPHGGSTAPPPQPGAPTPDKQSIPRLPDYRGHSHGVTGSAASAAAKPIRRSARPTPSTRSADGLGTE